MSVENTIKDIKSFNLPLAACWCVKSWNPSTYVEEIKAGHRVFPTFGVPTIEQGAESAERAEKAISEHQEAIDFINEHQLPITLRWHNWLGDFSRKYWRRDKINWDESPLAWRIHNGELDDMPMPDALSPIQPWIEEGKIQAKTNFLAKLAEAMPDLPLIYFLENNECGYAKLGSTEGDNPVWNWLPDKDKYGRRDATLASIDGLKAVNYRMSLHFINNGELTYQEAAELLETAYLEKRLVYHTSLKTNLPKPWLGRVLLGGYSGDLCRGIGLGHNPEHWALEPQWYKHRLYLTSHVHWEIPSMSVYDEVWHGYWWDELRSAQMRSADLEWFWRKDRPNNPFNEISFRVDPRRDYQTFDKDHHGIVGLDGEKGFLRYVLWATRQKNKATVVRFFASSTTLRNTPWFKETYQTKLAEAGYPEEVTKVTYQDHWDNILSVVDEVSLDPILRKFWTEGERVVNPDTKGSFLRWELPEQFGIEDDRWQHLYSDVDKPRDEWPYKLGNMPMLVFAIAFRVENVYLLYAFSPAGNIPATIQVPGYGDVSVTLAKEGKFYLLTPDCGKEVETDPDCEEDPAIEPHQSGSDTDNSTIGSETSTDNATIGSETSTDNATIGSETSTDNSTTGSGSSANSISSLSTSVEPFIEFGS